MNKERRIRLEKIVFALEDLRDQIESIKVEEEGCYDNLPEGLQDSERGEQMQENIDNLDEVYDQVDEAISTLRDVVYA